MRSYFLVIFLVLPFIVSAHFNNWDNDKGSNRCNKNDADRLLCSLDQLNEITNVPALPSGAPPTNDGFAYSQISYSDTTLTIAGQNGYDTCGRLVARDYDYNTGKSHSLTRIAIAYLNMAAAMECFNMKITDISELFVFITDSWNRTRYETDTQVNNFIDERSLVNWVQIFFWGLNQPKMARTLPGPYLLSRGDTFEVTPLPVPRINQSKKTCLETNKIPFSAQVLLNWTLTRNPPADMDNFLFSKTGYRLGRGLGPCNLTLYPEQRNDDWSRSDIKKAPMYGDDGDILKAENWDVTTMKTRCVSIPARVDSLQSIPAANFFVRTQGFRNPGKSVFVFVHGTSASHNYLRGVQNLLSRRYFTVGIDLRGHGQSQVTPATVPFADGFRYTNEAFADDIFYILQALNITEKINYMGISIGASIGLVFSAKYPSKVDRLIPISGATQFRCIDFPNMNCQTWLAGTAPTTPFTLLPEDVLSGCNVDNARAKINQNRQANTSGVAVASLLEYTQKQDLSPYLSQVKAPTLIIYGLGDTTLGNSSAAFLHANIKNSVRADFVNRGHLLTITAFVDVSNLALRFVNSNSFPEYTRVLDTGCQIDPEVKPEYPFDKCPSV